MVFVNKNVNKNGEDHAKKTTHFSSVFLEYLVYRLK